MRLNLKFYKNIIESDFFFLKKKLNKNHFTNSRLDISTLNISQLVISLKQFIKLLSFVNCIPEKKLVIFVRDKQIYFLLKSLLIDHRNKIDIRTTFTVLTDENSFGLILDDFSLSTNMYSNLFNNKIYMLSKINSNCEMNNVGYYKIYNDIGGDIKKYIFLVSLIKSIFNK